MHSQQVTGNEVMAVAFGRVFFTAHDASGMHTGGFEQLLDALEEPEAFHHFRIVYFLQVITRFCWDCLMLIARWVFWPTTQLVAGKYILDVLSFDRLLQGLLVELGIETAVRRAAYIHQDFDPVIYEQLDEFVDRVAAVPDGVEIHAKDYPLANPMAAWKDK